MGLNFNFLFYRNVIVIISGVDVLYELTDLCNPDLCRLTIYFIAFSSILFFLFVDSLTSCLKLCNSLFLLLKLLLCFHLTNCLSISLRTSSKKCVHILYAVFHVYLYDPGKSFNSLLWRTLCRWSCASCFWNVAAKKEPTSDITVFWGSGSA